MAASFCSHTVIVSTVDDGTGVINCLCWKSNLLKEAEDPSECGSKWHRHPIKTDWILM